MKFRCCILILLIVGAMIQDSTSMNVKTKAFKEMTTLSGDSLLARPSLLPQGDRRVLPRGVKRGVFSAWDILPHPLPTFVAIVPKKHIAAVVERNGKFVKMIESGKHNLFPFFEKINGAYRNEYPIPELTEYDVGGTIKLKLINMARHQEQSLMIDILMDKARTVLEETINESYLLDVGLVKEEFNKFAEDQINKKLAEDPKNNYSLELNMTYVQKLSPRERIERIKENRRKEKKIMEKKEEENKNLGAMGNILAMAILALICGVIVPKELRVVITIAMQIYIISSLSR